MSGPEQDPLAQLSRQAMPEPDAARMRATIAASTQAFAQAAAEKQRQTAKPGLMEHLRGLLLRPGGWFVPAGMVAVAAIGFVVVTPALQDVVTPARQDAAPAPEHEVASRPAPTAAPQSLSRSVAPAPPMAAAPQPRDEGTAKRSMSVRGGPPMPAPIERRSFDGLDLGLRTTPQMTQLYLLEDGREEPLHVWFASDSPGTVTVTDAFRHEGLIITRSGPGDQQRWDAFERRDGYFARSVALSRLIGDAPSRADVETRLRAGMP